MQVDGLQHYYVLMLFKPSDISGDLEVRKLISSKADHHTDVGF